MLAPLICLVGRSGSGKSTLADYLLQNLPKSRFLRYYTTRKPRSLRERFFSKEYVFLSNKRYGKLKSKTILWEEFEAGGFLYGVSIDEVQALRNKGVIFISTLLPQKKSIQSRKEFFGNNVFCINLMVAQKLLNKRALDSKRTSRKEESHSNYSDLIDLSLDQSGKINEDLQRCLAEIQLFLI